MSEYASLRPELTCTHINIVGLRMADVGHVLEASPLSSVPSSYIFRDAGVGVSVPGRSWT